MTRYCVAFSVGFLLLSVSIPSAGQTSKSFDDTPEASVLVPRGMQAGGPPQSPNDSSVIVVKPQLTEEQLADLYMVRKEYHEAALLYKKLSDQEPRNPVYLNKLGIALHQQTALTMALKYYEKAAKVDPMYADAQNNIGTIWYQRKKYAESILAFRQALTIDPKLFENNGSRAGSVLQDRSVSDRGRFYFMLAKSFAEAGDLDRCLHYLRKAKEEGFVGLAADVKKDPAFTAVLEDPAIGEILAPKPASETTPQQ